MPMSEVLMLGVVQPPLTMQWLNPKPTTPSVPQNLMRQTMQNSMHALGAVENLGLGNLGKVLRALGAASDDSVMAEPISPSQVPNVNAQVQVPPGGTPSTTQLNKQGAVIVVQDGYGRAALITLSTVSAAASAYHGYKRNQSVGWAAVWALMGGIFPVITPAVAVAQGFGQRERR